MPQSILDIRNLSKRYGTTQAVREFSLSVEAGEFVTLLGPSGCGKTTTLRMIMGFIRSDTGTITLDSRPLVNVASGIYVPAEARSMAMVFQSYAVWPHMTVYDNVAYPNKLKKLSRQQVRERTEHALELVNMSEYAARHPHELSGGQQQRVALARALAMRATLLLLDEPLSNLDAKLRETMRFEIRELQRETNSTTIYVTHDQTEAMAMSDRIVVMSEGQIEQIGTPEEVYARPVNKFVASFIGTANFLRCRVVDSTGEQATVRMNGGYEIQAVKGPELPDGPPNGILLVRPEDLVMEESRGEKGIAAVVERRTYLGDTIDYLVKIGDASVRVASNGRPARFQKGDQVTVRLAREPYLLEVRAE